MDNQNSHAAGSIQLLIFLLETMTETERLSGTFFFIQPFQLPAAGAESRVRQD